MRSLCTRQGGTGCGRTIAPETGLGKREGSHTLVMGSGGRAGASLSLVWSRNCRSPKFGSWSSNGSGRARCLSQTAPFPPRVAPEAGARVPCAGSRLLPGGTNAKSQGFGCTSAAPWSGARSPTGSPSRVGRRGHRAPWPTRRGFAPKGGALKGPPTDLREPPSTSDPKVGIRNPYVVALELKRKGLPIPGLPQETGR